MPLNSETRRHEGSALLNISLGSDTSEVTPNNTENQCKALAQQWIARRYSVSAVLAGVIASLAFGEVTR